jgi:hypothetical protein
MKGADVSQPDTDKALAAIERGQETKPFVRQVRAATRRKYISEEKICVVNGGEIMYHQGGSRAEIWRLKTVPPIAFNQERPNLTEGGLDVQGGNVPPCSQGLHDRRIAPVQSCARPC